MAIDKEGRFVPRHRKRKALDRARDKNAKTDPNTLEVLAEQNSVHEDRLRKHLKPEGVRFSSKKAKRLEKYIGNKLRKDESKQLLAKLAETRIDTSLLCSSRSLGQTKESKREAVRRAFREEKAGLELDEARKELLYQPRRASLESDEGGDSAVEKTEPEPKQESLARPAPLGSGLKRPLETDESGRPILAKRQKRGGVKSKTCFVTQAMPVAAEDDVSESEWNGFSSEASLDSDVDQAEAEVSGSDDDSDGDSSGGSADEDDAAAAERRKERSLAFKAWAHQQRNEALGYESIESGGPGVLEVPKPKDFQPRPLEQDEVPQELQPTSTDASRKAYSVTVTREPNIESARLQLPVVAEEQRIMEAIHNNHVVVICGATGSGKTTQVPQFLFEAGYGSQGSPTAGMIGVTQPRRVAAVSMSRRVAQELGDHGSKVAYQIRFEGTANANTAIKFMTDGVLLREVAVDIALRKYSAIIIDEAHERSVNTDILIGMLSRVVKLRAELAQEDQSVRPLKLVIMSATLRIEDFVLNTTLFPTPPPVVNVEGRQHHVTIHFARKTYHDYVEDAFRKISRGHRQLPPGGMLVFLTGQAEVFRLGKLLRAAFGGMHSATAPNVRIPASQAPQEVEDVDFGDMDDRNVNDVHDELDPILDDKEDEQEEGEFELPDEEAGTGPARMQILALYSLLPTREQMKVFEAPPDGSRQVILSTNVAETSLTIPGIRYVFDCGRSKERRYERLSGVQSFEVGWISKASANQRSGRAGRTGPGHCWRLYSSAVYERDFPEYTDPEILRMPIEGVVLQLKAMHLQHVVNFPFPTPPDRQSLAQAEKTLMYLSALSPEGQITKIGSTMSLFPLAPRFSRILLLGHLQDCMQYAITLVAGLSVPEIFIPEKQIMTALPEPDPDGIRTTEDVVAEDKRDKLRQAFHAVHRNLCFLDDKSDAIKILQVVGEFAHEPTEAWCESRFVRYKVLKETQQLRRQLVELLRTNMAAFASLRLEEKLPAPTPAQVQALKQMVAVGFIDQVAIRADLAPNPPPAPDRKPRRAIDVPYLTLAPLHGADPADNLVYIHPTSPLAHLAVAECPQYVVYAHLQRAGNVMDEKEARKPKTRMHALTDVTGAQLANLAKGTRLLTYGKPIKEVKGAGSSGTHREVWVVPYLRAETAGGRLGWPLPARKVKQRKIPAKGWVEDTA